MPLECIPVIVEIHGTQIQHCLRTFGGPPHSRQFRAILDQMTASTFRHAAPDRLSGGQVFIIVHEPPVTLQIPDYLRQPTGL